MMVFGMSEIFSIRKVGGLSLRLQFAASVHSHCQELMQVICYFHFPKISSPEGAREIAVRENLLNYLANHSLSSESFFCPLKEVNFILLCHCA